MKQGTDREGKQGDRSNIVSTGRMKKNPFS